MLTCDVVIVGAGPAGSAAAISAARAGREVVLVDKATFPRDKCCGDGLTALALRLSERLRSDDVEVQLVKTGDHRLSEPDDLVRLTRTLDALLDK